MGYIIINLWKHQQSDLKFIGNLPMLNENRSRRLWVGEPYCDDFDPSKFFKAFWGNDDEAPSLKTCANFD